MNEPSVNDIGFENTENPYRNTTEVIWGDGTRDIRRGSGGSDKTACIQCGLQNCRKPVYNEAYHIKTNRIAYDWEQEYPVIGSGGFDKDCKCSQQ